MPKAEDLTGRVFGKWVVIKEIEKDKHGKRCCLVRCECGRECALPLGNLTRKLSTCCRHCSGNARSKGSGPVHEARVAMGMSQREFAAYAGLSQRSVWLAERDGRPFTDFKHGALAALKFNKVAPREFRQKRKAYKSYGKQRMRLRNVVITHCAYCGKLVEQQAKNHEKGMAPACCRSHISLFRIHGPKPLDTTATHLKPETVAQFNPIAKDTRKVDKWAGVKKKLQQKDAP